MNDPYGPRNLWVVASRRRDDAYLLSNGDEAYITYHTHYPQGKTCVEGPFPADEAGPGWKWFDVPLPYRGPLRGLSREELDWRSGGT